MLPHWRIGEDVEVVNLKPDRRNGLFAAPMAGAYAMPGLAVVVIMELAEPAPIKYIPLVIINVELHVAEPADTLIVSPTVAFVTQVFTDAWSGVVVHVGLDPVQAAKRLPIIKRLNKQTNATNFNDLVMLSLYAVPLQIEQKSESNKIT